MFIYFLQVLFIFQVLNSLPIYASDELDFFKCQRNMLQTNKEARLRSIGPGPSSANHQKHDVVLIFGDGVYSTAFASMLATYSAKLVIIKSRKQNQVDLINKGFHHNPKLLVRDHSGNENEEMLPNNIIASTDMSEIKQIIRKHDFKVDLVLVGVTSKGTVSVIRDNLQDIIELTQFGHEVPAPITILDKGPDPKTNLPKNQVLSKEFPMLENQFSFLGGGAFARGIVTGSQLTAVSLAGKQGTDESLRLAKDVLSTPHFVVRRTRDVDGLELGGYLKNILAILAGCIEGYYTDNPKKRDKTKAKLFQLGLNANQIFSEIYNANKKTFLGPSGMGDLYLTMNPGSRNYNFGKRIAEENAKIDGLTAQEILKEIENSGDTVEGASSIDSVIQVLKDYSEEIHKRGIESAIHLFVLANKLKKGHVTPKDIADFVNNEFQNELENFERELSHFNSNGQIKEVFGENISVNEKAQNFKVNPFKLLKPKDQMAEQYKLGAKIKDILSFSAGLIKGMEGEVNAANPLSVLLIVARKEIHRIAKSQRASTEAIFGPTFMADLYYVIGPQGKNISLGEEFAKLRLQGKDIDKKKMETLNSGISVSVMNKYLEKYNIDSPLIKTLYQIVYEKKDPRTIYQTLKKSAEGDDNLYSQP
ncbi:MAG: hypothetical protein H6622_11295 [Halobacteriovoraceae bacterium]|nr:hypothetical protein [Halobacteriovoraceae bacterium]